MSISSVREKAQQPEHNVDLTDPWTLVEGALPVDRSVLDEDVPHVDQLVLYEDTDQWVLTEGAPPLDQSDFKFNQFTNNSYVGAVQYITYNRLQSFHF